MQRFVVPVLVFPSPSDVAHPAGILTRFERRQVPFIAIMCERGDLDTMVTAVRRWFLERPEYASLRTLVLESPRFQPILITGGDGSITPKSITRDTLQSLLEEGVSTNSSSTLGEQPFPEKGVDPSTPPR
jgi:hypothetical protein